MHFINLLKVRLMFSDFEGKGYNYSQIMVQCSIMQIAPYKGFSSTRGQTQQPLVCLWLCKVREPTNVCWQGVTCSFGSGCNLYCTLTSLGAVFPTSEIHFATGSLINLWGSQRWRDEMRWFCRLCTCQGVDKRQRMVRKKNKLLTYLIEAQQKGIFREWKILESNKKFHMQKQVLIFFGKKNKFCNSHITSSSKARCTLTSTGKTHSAHVDEKL